MPAKTKTKEVNLVDRVNDLFDTHTALIADILKSNAFTEDAEVEIDEANSNLQTDIIKLYEDLQVDTVEQALAVLKKKNENNDLAEDDYTEMLELIDEERIAENLADKNYIYVQIESADKRSKLEAFLKTEIFPFYNDQLAAVTNIF